MGLGRSPARGCLRATAFVGGVMRRRAGQMAGQVSQHGEAGAVPRVWTCPGLAELHGRTPAHLLEPHYTDATVVTPEGQGLQCWRLPLTLRLAWAGTKAASCSPASSSACTQGPTMHLHSNIELAARQARCHRLDCECAAPPARTSSSEASGDARAAAARRCRRRRPGCPRFKPRAGTPTPIACGHGSTN